MPQVLYRQYRPQIFSEVVNQELIKKTLRNAVTRGEVAHAYLFTGSRGVGKTSLARILAKAVNCLKPKSGEPCDSCVNCEAVKEGRFLDLIEIDAASHTGVDNIREIIEHVKFTPSSGKYKVIVIDEVHMLSKGAFNALLKTLEEPPSHALFILATTELSKVPATIVSRTQRFDFKRLTAPDIAGRLEQVAADGKLKVSKEIMNLIARSADGSLRDALSMFDQLSTFGFESLTLSNAEEILGQSGLRLHQEFLDKIMSGNASSVLEFLKSLVSTGKDVFIFTNGFLEYLDLVLNRIVVGEKSAGEIFTGEDLTALERHVKLGQEPIVVLTKLVLQSAQRIKYSPLPELPLELAVLEFLFDKDSPEERRLNQGLGIREAGRTIETAQQAVKKVEKSVNKKPTSDNPNLFFEDVQKHWTQFLEHMKKYNHSLISSLRLATIVNVSENKIDLSFPYRFHKEAVEQRKNKIVIEKAMEEVLGRQIRIGSHLDIEIDRDTFKENPNPISKKGLMEEALKVFRIDSTNSS